jgi:hypothetical protein
MTDGRPPPGVAVSGDVEVVIEDVLGDGTLLWLDDRVEPYRAYVLVPDRPPSPAMYLEFEEGEAVRPVVVHNFAHFPTALGRWDLDPADLLALDELHELTHWAMTDEERARWDARSRRTGQPDGRWLNPVLLDVLEHLDGRERGRRRRTLLDRAVGWLRDR